MSMIVNPYRFGSGLLVTTALTVINPGAELGSISGWAHSSMANFTAGVNSITPRTGSYFFWGGLIVGGTLKYLSQTLTVPGSAYAGVDAGAYNLKFSKWISANSTTLYSISCVIFFYDGSGNMIGFHTSQQHFPAAPLTWEEDVVSSTPKVPVGTRTISVEIDMQGSGTNMYIGVDDISATLTIHNAEVQVETANAAAVMGSSVSGVSVVDSTASAILGNNLAGVTVSDAVTFFILTP